MKYMEIESCIMCPGRPGVAARCVFVAKEGGRDFTDEEARAMKNKIPSWCPLRIEYVAFRLEEDPFSETRTGIRRMIEKGPIEIFASLRAKNVVVPEEIAREEYASFRMGEDTPMLVGQKGVDVSLRFGPRNAEYIYDCHFPWQSIVHVTPLYIDDEDQDLPEKPKFEVIEGGGEDSGEGEEE